VLRIQPPIPVVATKIAIKNTVVAEHFIPKGAYVSGLIIRAHFDENLWKNPFEFNPDRFSQNQSHQILSFSYGPRMCIGHKFSMMESVIALSLLVHEFQWTIPMDYVWKDDPKSSTTFPKGGLPIIFKKRK